jgi:hypothetical protein
MPKNEDNGVPEKQDDLNSLLVQAEISVSDLHPFPSILPISF